MMIGLGLAGALVGVVSGRVSSTNSSVVSGKPPAAQMHMRRGRVRAGTELLAILIVSSVCGASEYDALPGDVEKIRAGLSRRAREHGWHFSALGIALDERPADGLAFLQRFGPLDEVLAGGSWLNTGSVEYLVRNLPGAMAVPSLIVIDRTVQTGPKRLVVGDDHVLARLVGLREISAYAQHVDTVSLSPP